MIVAHLGLAVLGAFRNSTTFDETFHLASGAFAAAEGELRISAVNPHLVKAIAGAVAIAAGARLPHSTDLTSYEQGEVGRAFASANAPRFHRIVVSARMVTVMLSGLLVWVVWRWSRRLWGSRGGLLSLAFAAFAPELLAHAGVVTMDTPTSLGFLGTLAAWERFLTSGRWRDAALTALGLAFTFLIRFTAVFLPVLLLITAIVQWAAHRVRSPRRVALSVLGLMLTTLLALWAGYLGRVSFAPLRSFAFESHTFQSVQDRFPDLRLPLPDVWLSGFDRQAVESQAGTTPSYLLGELHREMPLAYYPVALAAKWPIGFLAALILLVVYALRCRPSPLRMFWALTAGIAFLAIGMFVGRLGIGIRYVLPLVPSCAVAMGALGRRTQHESPFWLRTAVLCAFLAMVETAFHAPWYLSFYNVVAGGAPRGMWIVNDSNVDWGQGLIALRAEMEKRGIRRIHLAYHGTVDPALYGIDYIPYPGGTPGRESDWICISDYYFVGLAQHMVTREGRSPEAMRFDFRPLWGRPPVARPADCMELYRLR